jgi:hypothetical protein
MCVLERAGGARAKTAGGVVKGSSRVRAGAARKRLQVETNAGRERRTWKGMHWW